MLLAVHLDSRARFFPRARWHNLALAELKAKSGDSSGALADLREAAKTQPGSALIYEQIGDMEKARGDAAQAAQAYQTALRNTQDRSARKRLRTKLRTQPDK